MQSPLMDTQQPSGEVQAWKGKGKDKVWSVDNDAANESRGGERRKKGYRRRTKVRNSSTKRRRASESDEGVMVSGSILIEMENVLQTQAKVDTVVAVGPALEIRSDMRPAAAAAETTSAS
ncbi:hypothetical protein L2E82_18501 [Cichorium intybus]|uniref:Uncharacterized protein n=1 Tax=Cichorium intybus TaxID=13427 RepID=A0ACB9F9S4_CICIN|nr:hypothetical protein L2E82_18501 [Cichorium intybus]